MTIHLKLDQQAMNALFPEGSEARVQLQNCVVQSMARTFIKGLTMDFINQSVTGQIYEAVADTVKAHFDTNYERGSFRTQLAPKEQVRKALSAAADEELFKQIAEVKADMKARMEELVNEALVDVRLNLDMKLNAEIVKRVREQIKASL